MIEMQEAFVNAQKRIDEMPRRLAMARRQLGDIKRLLIDVAKRQGEIKAEIAAFVASETWAVPGKGKDGASEIIQPKFKSKEARDLEVQIRLTTYQPFLDTVAQQDKLEIDKLNAEIVLGEIEDEDRALQRHLEVLGHQARQMTLMQYTQVMVDHLTPLFKNGGRT